MGEKNRQSAGSFLTVLVMLLTLLPVFSFIVFTLSKSGTPGTEESTVFFTASRLLTKANLRALSFSLQQAALSTISAVAIGLPGAYFVARYRFRTRRLFFSLAAVPFCLPPVLVILSFILYFGKSGFLAAAFARAGLPFLKSSSFLYSMTGLVFIHAFYNFPIVIQTVGALWSQLPDSREEAARTLGAGRAKAFLAGTLPYLLPALFQAASLIFLFCFFSFTLVLVFGGLSGSTLEVEIYRATRFSGDYSKALFLGIVQTAMAMLVVSIFVHFDNKTTQIAKGFGVGRTRPEPHGQARIALFLYQLMVAVFFIGPLIALVFEGFTVRSSLAGNAQIGIGNFEKIFKDGGKPLVPALFNSLIIGAVVAAAATLIGLGIAASEHYGKQKTNILTALPLALSPAIVALGWATLLQSSSIAAIIAGQTVMAWPFVARNLGASFKSLDRTKYEAARVLGAHKAQAFWRVDMPMLLPSIASAGAFAFAIALGDANIPIILGSGKYETLPLLLYRLVSAYRFSEACAVGIVLAIVAGIAFYLKEKTSELL